MKPGRGCATRVLNGGWNSGSTMAGAESGLSVPGIYVVAVVLVQITLAPGNNISQATVTLEGTAGS